MCRRRSNNLAVTSATDFEARRSASSAEPLDLFSASFRSKSIRQIYLLAYNYTIPGASRAGINSSQSGQLEVPMKTLVTRKGNLDARRFFRKKLREIAGKPKELEWSFPNGSREKYLTYLVKTYLGKLQIGVLERWRGRNLHLIRFAQRQGSLPPGVELNTPVAHNRRVAGLYAKDANGEIWLCSRGSFTAGGKIPYDFSLSYFNEWLYEIDDAGKLLQIIPVCSLSSPKIFDDIATFTTAVQELKKKYKGESYKIISPPKNSLKN